MITKFENIELLDAFISKELKHDKAKLYAMKKASFKEADSFSFDLSKLDSKDESIKAIVTNPIIDANKIRVKSIINTTNLLDSHGDVHIKNIWKKSIQESKSMYLLNSHQQKFEYVITDSVTPLAQTMSWKSLGFDFEGNTQALVFDSIIEKTKYNELMFDMYASGKVKNHSVGMQYVKILYCVNSDDSYWQEEKANWGKYINEVANKDEAESSGNFWAVLEAKIIEGSAVLRGSNYATPTQSVTEVKNEADIITSTIIEPSQDTQITNNAQSKVQKLLSINNQKK
jgi:hypothetical protein